LYLKSIVSGSTVQDTPIRAQPLSVVIPEVQPTLNAAKEAVPWAHEIGGVLKLRDEDEAEVKASDKCGAIPPTVGAEAAMTSIPVIELDRPETPIFYVEVEVETSEESALNSATNYGEVARSPDAQVGASGEGA
jgi:hypothetical protein